MEPEHWRTSWRCISCGRYLRMILFGMRLRALSLARLVVSNDNPHHRLSIVRCLQFLLHIYKGLIQLAVTGADASCIYLESLFFTLPFLCTIEYTHTVLSNFHTVTILVQKYVYGFFLIAIMGGVHIFMPKSRVTAITVPELSTYATLPFLHAVRWR